MAAGTEALIAASDGPHQTGATAMMMVMGREGPGTPLSRADPIEMSTPELNGERYGDDARATLRCDARVTFRDRLERPAKCEWSMASGIQHGEGKEK
jgi:hypothetical protein